MKLKAIHGIPRDQFGPLALDMKPLWVMILHRKKTEQLILIKG